MKRIRPAIWLIVGIYTAEMNSLAFAQAWIGPIIGQKVHDDKEYQCMMGRGPADDMINNVRTDANNLVSSYWKYVQLGDFGSVVELFRHYKSSYWKSDQTRLSVDQFSQIKDSINRADNRIDLTPRDFVRAGDGFSATGIWAVRDHENNLIGYYTATFRRATKASGWKIYTLEVSAGVPPPASLPQYCHDFGDVAPFVKKQEDLSLERVRKKAARIAREQSDRAN